MDIDMRNRVCSGSAYFGAGQTLQHMVCGSGSCGGLYRRAVRWMHKERVRG